MAIRTNVKPNNFGPLRDGGDQLLLYYFPFTVTCSAQVQCDAVFLQMQLLHERHWKALHDKAGKTPTGTFQNLKKCYKVKRREHRLFRCTISLQIHGLILKLARVALPYWI